MIKLEAKITWNSEEDGCLENPFSGIQPSLLVNGDLIMSRVEHKDGFELMERGKTYDVVIHLPYGEIYSEYLVSGLVIQLQAGKRVIATGLVTCV